MPIRKYVAILVGMLTDPNEFSSGGLMLMTVLCSIKLQFLIYPVQTWVHLRDGSEGLF